jgi:hypothetical protein
MSTKSMFVGGFLALAALVMGGSTASAQFISNRTVVTTASGYRAPIYQHYSNNGAFGTPLVTSSYFPQQTFYQPVYQPYYQPVVVNRFYSNTVYGGGFSPYYGGFNSGFSPYYGGFNSGFGRPAVGIGFNFNFR